MFLVTGLEARTGADSRREWLVDVELEADFLTGGSLGLMLVVNQLGRAISRLIRNFSVGIAFVVKQIVVIDHRLSSQAAFREHQDDFQFPWDA